MSVLYKNLESLDVLEQLDNNTYDFIYLDIPYSTNSHDYFNYEFEKYSDGLSLKSYICKTQGISRRDIKQEDIKKERVKWENRGFKEYSGYVSRVIDNTYRILKDNGILAFLAPENDYTRINYKLVLDQFFPSITNVTLKMGPVTTNHATGANRDLMLYFCSKTQNYEFPVLMELPPKDTYRHQDDHGDYILSPVILKSRGENDGYHYEWHGISPSDGRCWRLTKEETEELFKEDRIVINNNRVFKKVYRDERLVPVSTIWEYNDTVGVRHYGRYIDSQSIERMFEMFVKPESEILCPYDRDGKFSYLADKHSFTWTSVCPAGFFNNRRNSFCEIPQNHYTIIEKLNNHANRVYQESIITGVDDIYELKEMKTQVSEIQNLVGADSPEEAIDEIQRLIDATVSESSISACLPEAQNWVEPYWDKLESESQHFIPTGVALYNQFLQDPDADMAAPLIEYCKALESELLKKLFVGYVKEVRERINMKPINIEEQFPGAMDNEKTGQFALFLRNSLNHSNIKRPQMWKIELGTMIRVLTEVLENESQEPLFVDFRDYLNRAFEQDFFGSDFCSQLDFITKLRNNCAHPYIVNKDDAAENREMIKEKLMIILEYYKDKDDK